MHYSINNKLRSVAIKQNVKCTLFYNFHYRIRIITCCINYKGEATHDFANYAKRKEILRIVIYLQLTLT